MTAPPHVPSPDAKRCPRCGQTLPPSDFGARRSTRDGRAVYCRPCTNAIGREATAKRSASRPPLVTACRECATEFSPTRRSAVYCSLPCRAAGVKRRSAENHEAWYRANWAERRAKAKAWKKANPERCRVHRARIYASHRAQERAAHTAWVEANRTHYLALQRDYSRRRAAIAEGKAQYAGAGGFVLVRYAYRGETFWRAAPRDRRVGPNEAVVAVYEAIDGRWCVFAPAVAGPDVRKIVVKLVKSEQGRRRMKEAA